MLSFLIEKEFKQLARNKIIPRMLVALPLMAMLVFPWAANLEIKNVRVDVVDNDHSPLSQRLVAEIGGSAYFNISGTSDSYPDALRVSYCSPSLSSKSSRSCRSLSSPKLP